MRSPKSLSPDGVAHDVGARLDEEPAAVARAFCGDRGLVGAACVELRRDSHHRRQRFVRPESAL